MKIERTCVFCGKKSYVQLNEQEAIDYATKDDIIQRVLPRISVTDREILINGTCAICQEELYGKDE